MRVILQILWKNMILSAVKKNPHKLLGGKCLVSICRRKIQSIFAEHN